MCAPQAMEILDRKARDDTADEEVTGSGHIKQGGTGTHNGQNNAVSPAAQM